VFKKNCKSAVYTAAFIRAGILASACAAIVIAPSTSSAEEQTSSVNWDGQYVGVSAGLSRATAKPSVNAKGTTYFNAIDQNQLDPLASHNHKSTNFTGTLFGGFNRQVGNVVLGLEGDFSLVDFDEQHTVNNVAYTSLPGRRFSMTTDVEAKWMASLRPRLGYAQDKSLFFVSAGPALSRFKYNFTFADEAPRSTSVSKNKLKVGVAAGLGYEYRFHDTWSLKAEYLFSDFNIGKASSALTTSTADGFNHKVDFTTNHFRIGVVKAF